MLRNLSDLSGFAAAQASLYATPKFVANL